MPETLVLPDAEMRHRMRLAYRDLNEIETQAGIPRTEVPAMYTEWVPPPRRSTGLLLPLGRHATARPNVPPPLTAVPALAPVSPPQRRWSPPPLSHYTPPYQPGNPGLSLPLPIFGYRGPLWEPPHA